MKKPSYWWQIFGFLFASAAGTLLHFVYEWSGKSVLAAPISGVNESTWEHMKLLFVPMLLYAVVQSFFVKDASYWCAKALGSLSGLMAIPVLYYTLNGALGKTSARVNMFFLAIFSWSMIDVFSVSIVIAMHFINKDLRKMIKYLFISSLFKS